MWRLEMHTHTKFSHDSLCGRWSYLWRLKSKKINVVAITDHNEIKGAKVYQRFLKRFGITVIIGEEIFTKQGEIIGLFLNEKIEPNLTVEETIKQIKAQGGIVYVPHPYDESRAKCVLPVTIIEQFKQDIDCIEIHNGRNRRIIYSMRQKAIADCFPNLIQVIGSDAHAIFELGRNVHQIEPFYSKEQFLRNLAVSQYESKPCIQQAHTMTKWVCAYKLIRQGQLAKFINIFNYKRRKRSIIHER
jgi:predicted metal-dependent phosphoesterase TrpH